MQNRGTAPVTAQSFSISHTYWALGLGAAMRACRATVHYMAP